MNDSDDKGMLLVWAIIIIGIILAVWRAATGVDDGSFD